MLHDVCQRESLQTIGAHLMPSAASSVKALKGNQCMDAPREIHSLDLIQQPVQREGTLTLYVRSSKPVSTFAVVDDVADFCENFAISYSCLQCFVTVRWASERTSGL